MIDFTITARDFKKAVKIVLVGRAEHAQEDTADFILRGDELQICSTGTSTNVAATVASAGYARMTIPMLRKMLKLAATFKQERLRIRIEAERVRIETFGISSPDIELKPLGGRIADVPVNASTLDLIALLKLYSHEEIEESGLAARVAKAQEIAIADLDRAASSLKEYGVRRDDIRHLMETAISDHAKTITRALGATKS